MTKKNRHISNTESRLWAMVAEIQKGNEMNKDVTIEIEILTNAFSCE